MTKRPRHQLHRAEAAIRHRRPGPRTGTQRETAAGLSAVGEARAVERWTPASIPGQSGRLAIVTGANSGIGYMTARELARRGAHVVLACRSPERGQTALDRLRTEAPSARAELGRLDIGDLGSVRDFAGR
jgi:hypothetical protein